MLVLIRALKFGQFCACIAGLLTLNATAADLNIQITDSRDRAISDAVVYVTAMSSEMQSSVEIADIAVMEQHELQFTPYVLPVQRGTIVSFPNRDRVKHHVYSFSSAKRFQLKLYSGGKENPVRLDQIGVVALGCNIHDWMLGYIYVVDTPYFSKTDAHGMAVISELPEGEYKVMVWHPRLKHPTGLSEQVLQIGADHNPQINLSIEVKSDNRRKPPSEENNGYSDF